MKKVLVIGGAGYIGSVLSDHLLTGDYEVRCLDLLLYGQHQCILPYLVKDRYEFLYGDYTDEKVVKSALRGVTDVIILAGLVGDPITKKYPEASQKINHHGMIALLKQLNGQGLHKVIFASTCSNYGLIEDERLADENFPLNPLSLYAKAKVAIEQELLALRGKVDYSPTILRFATAFGLSPRMRFDLTVNEFIRELFLGHDLLVYDPQTWRPYCHVKDFARALQSVLEAPFETTAFEVFNVGGEKNNYTKQMIVDAIKTFLPDSKITYKAHGTDPRNYRVNFTKVQEQLHFSPRYTVQDGIRELLDPLEQHVFDEVETNKNLFGNYSINYSTK